MVMKKEFFYIGVLLVILTGSFIYKSFFLSDTVVETKRLIQENSEMTAKYNRDKAVQNRIDSIRTFFEFNHRPLDSFPYGDVIVTLLSTVEEILNETGIKYNDNSIRQDSQDQLDYKSGTRTFRISVNFTTDYEKLNKFLSKIEKSRHNINVASLKLLRSREEIKNESGKLDKKEGEVFDEFNVKVNIDCFIDLEFVKYF
jgi:uncharacterized OsmC-like protein